MKVKSNATYVYRCMGVNILPGLNFVTEPSFFEHPAVKARFQSGVLEMVYDGAGPEIVYDASQHGQPKAERLPDFSGMNAKDLAKEIALIFDVNVLEKIKSSDNRVTVQKAVDDQILKIKGSDDAHA